MEKFNKILKPNFVSCFFGGVIGNQKIVKIHDLINADFEPFQRQRDISVCSCLNEFEESEVFQRVKWSK